MDQLIASFQRGASISFANQTGFDLDWVPGQGVWTKQGIHAGTCLGMLEGVVRDIWDVKHSEYMFVDAERVLDVSSSTSPRNILTLLRDDNESKHSPNCYVVVFGSNCFLYVATDVAAGSELVYDVRMHQVCGNEKNEIG